MVPNAVLIAAATLASAARLPPIDQCIGDASFVRFRSSLQAIVARRDAQALLETVADDVMVDFGAGSQGPREFARVWNLDGPPAKAKASRVWRELALVLTLGCARVGPSRIVPSLVEQLSDDDQFDKLVALPGAKLRQSPDTGAPVLAILNYHSSRSRKVKRPKGGHVCPCPPAERAMCAGPRSERRCSTAHNSSRSGGAGG